MSLPVPNDLVRSLRQVILRDLDILGKEITAYTDEAGLWKVEKSIANSAGTLCLHLCGNLQHFIGAVLGNTGYVRNRDYEFSARGLPKSHLLSEIAAARNAVEKTLSGLPPERLGQDFPIEMLGGRQTTAFILLHLAGHLNYHLGQVNYHRRLLAS
jgi:hypothetical protein